MTSTSTEPTYHGSCQCGSVRFSATTALNGLVQCNCSRCLRLNQVMQSVKADDFTLHAGEDFLTLYRFNTEKIAHRFCSVCGVQPFANGTDQKGNALYMVNVGCLEGASYDPATIVRFNGAQY